MRWTTFARTLTAAMLVVFSDAHAAKSADVLPTVDAVTTMVGAADRGHLWFCLEVQGKRPGFRLCLMEESSRPASFVMMNDALVLPRRPERMAAWGDRVWLVMPPDGSLGAERRDVMTVRAQVHRTTGDPFIQPYDSMEFVSSLPGWGTLAGFVGVEDGVVALLMPLPRHEDAVDADVGVPAPSTATTPPSELEPCLLRLRATAWEPLATPPSMSSGAAVAALGLTGANPGRLTIWTTAGPKGQTVVHQYLGEKIWTDHLLPYPLGDVRTIHSGESLPVILTRDRQGSMLHLAYIRDEMLLSVADLPEPEQPWLLLRGVNNLHVIEHEPTAAPPADARKSSRPDDRATASVASDMEPRLSHRRIDFISGRISASVPLAVAGSSMAEMLYVPVLLSVGMTAAMAAAIFRPGPKAAALSLPRRVAVATPVLRVLALLIDLAPAAVLTAFSLDVPLVDGLRSPMFALTVQQAAPALVAALLTVAHAAVGEMMTGRSLGKAMMDMRVVRHDGSPPRGWQTLVRAMFKLLTLCVPPLALFALLHPHGKGIGDTLARTVVVVEHEDSASAAGSE
jgi:uncharacterized RDD family membrane protein YckC